MAAVDVRLVRILASPYFCFTTYVLDRKDGNCVCHFVSELEKKIFLLGF
jgi:hypothetical protein